MYTTKLLKRFSLASYNPKKLLLELGIKLIDDLEPFIDKNLIKLY